MFVLFFKDELGIQYICERISTTYGITKKIEFAKKFDDSVNVNALLLQLERNHHLVNLEVDRALA